MTRRIRGPIGLFLHTGVLFCILLTACGHTPERHHPLYTELMPSIRKILVLPPEINMFENLADGNRVRLEAGRHAAVQDMQQAVIRSLRDKRFIIEVADRAVMAAPETQSVQSLFRAVNHSIQLHTYGPQLFPMKLKSFDYRLGPVASLLESSGADALILAIGQQTVCEHKPGAWISIALVDPQGRIVWYGTQGDAVIDAGLQSQENVQTMVDATLQRFPKGSS